MNAETLVREQLPTTPPHQRAVSVQERQNGRMQLATMLCRSRNIPQSLQGSPGDVYMVMEVCEDYNLNFALAVWEVSSIKGRAMFGGKLAAAMLHNSGKLATRLTYTYSGEGPQRTVTCSAVIKGETEPRTVDARWADAKTEHNDNWKKDPDQQLAYFVARKWGRRHAPEVLLGATFEGEIIDITPNDIRGDDINVRVIVPDDIKARAEALGSAREQERAEHAAIHSEAGHETETDAPEATPFAIPREGDEVRHWSSWASQLMSYVRAASTHDIVNDWTSANSAELYKLQQYDAGKYRRLIDMINHQLTLRTEGT
jgi:hypothetical protein